MPRITVSYRRADSAAIAGRIFDRLASRYGNDSVYMDIDAIPFGVDYRRHIDTLLHETDFLLVIIGPHWLGPRENGRNRIDDVTDPVRIELEAALRNGMTIVPVLVEGATMPTPDVLPAALEDFSFVNAAEITSGRDFHGHVDRVIRFLDRAMAQPAAAPAPDPVVPEPVPAQPAPPPPPPPPPVPRPKSPWWRTPAGTFGGVAAVALLIAAIALRQPKPEPTFATTPAPTLVPTLPATTATPATHAFATTCPMDDATVRENFSQTLRLWYAVPNEATLANRFLKINAPRGYGYHVYHVGPLRDATICTAIYGTRANQQATSSYSAAGLAFWVDDSVAKNLRQYAFFVAPNGTFHVSRLDHDKWTAMLPSSRSATIRTAGANVFNVLTVRLVGNTASFHINGTKVGEIHATPPQHPSYGGLVAETDRLERNDVTWYFGYYGVGP